MCVGVERCAWKKGRMLLGVKPQGREGVLDVGANVRGYAGGMGTGHCLAGHLTCLSVSLR